MKKLSPVSLARLRKFLAKNLSLPQELSTSLSAQLALIAGLSGLIYLLVFTLPFLVGLLTGLTAAYVGVGFPIVSSALVLTGGLNPGILLAYAGGLMGIRTGVSLLNPFSQTFQDRFIGHATVK